MRDNLTEVTLRQDEATEKIQTPTTNLQGTSKTEPQAKSSTRLESHYRLNFGANLPRKLSGLVLSVRSLTYA